MEASTMLNSPMSNDNSKGNSKPNNDSSIQANANYHSNAHAKNKHWAKWLPAILFAVIVHLVVVIAFLMMNRSNTSFLPTHQMTNVPSNAGNTSNPSTTSGNSGDAAPSITATQAEPTLLKTLTEAPSALTEPSAMTATAANPNTAASNTLNSLDSANTSTKQQATPTPFGAANATDQSQTPKAAANAGLSTKTNSRPTLTNPTAAASRQPRNSSNPTNSMANPVDPQDGSNAPNPNEGLLLSRDTAKTMSPATNRGTGNRASANVTSAATQYATTSQEIEAINEKLSQTIGAVKNRKMQQIEEDKRRQQAAHMQDQVQNVRQNVRQNPVNDMGQHSAKNNLDSPSKGQVGAAQINQVGKQLNVDKLAEAEFSVLDQPQEAQPLSSLPLDKDSAPAVNR